IEAELSIAYYAGKIIPDTKEEIADVYAPHKYLYLKEAESFAPSLDAGTKFIQAISDGLKQSMQKHPNLVLMGQDIAEYGGAFKVTEGFVTEFGKERVRNTP
ncbi:MAG TPA: dehydrogenase, partial [Ferruginibacter sp.]|nr:dehydrogenase [Ferruginibacter sp.]